ncbi:MAG TPA: glycoside hydrolase family 27 protein [Prolixibacteraceae bacterium]|nr:glycoside hydrolase family 27 protein [Prolixibacteraceae bacterium]
MKKSFTVLIALLVFSTFSQAQKFPGLALTPPMGWNSWNTFATNINEQIIKDMADTFVEEGLADAGYNYIVIDDGWMAKERDNLGFLVPDKIKFPNGMKVVSDYVHSKGLKFGIYNCAGAETCGGYPGSRGHEYQDAISYASWGVDYLKYDWCNTENLNAKGAYETMRDAIYSAGRPMVFSMCEWGDNQPWEWGENVGHLWRTTGDISACWDCEEHHGTWSSWGVLKIVDMRKDIRKAAGPGHWNDPDMMEIGNGMTVNEDRGHFALWSMMAAPLIMGNDLRKASQETLAILTNADVIAVDQDSLGIQGFVYKTQDSIEIWAKPLANDDWAICFLNRTETSKPLNFNWKENTINDDVFGYEVSFKDKHFAIRDLFTKKDCGTTNEILKAEIPKHDVLMVRLSKLKK